MNLFKRMIIKIITFTIIIISIWYIPNCFYKGSSNAITNPIKVGVLLIEFDDPYLSQVKETLQNIENENPAQVKFLFFDSKDNQAVQNAGIQNLVQEEVDLLLVNLVNPIEGNVLEIINKVKGRNIPLIFFNIELEIDTTNLAQNVMIITTDTKQAGVLQGQILVDLWKTNKIQMDKNKDNKLQYIMLADRSTNKASFNRITYPILTLNENGIQTEELAFNVCNLDKECAKSTIKSLFLRYGGTLEAIIANNDFMAIGAVEALQEYGYNKGDKTKTIPVVGIDATPEAKELIKKGYMAGTVIIQDPKDLANQLYSVGLNLVNNRDPIEGTSYKLYKKNMIVNPYYEYKP